MAYKLDHTTDYSHAELIAFLKTASELPSFVKEAELPDSDDVASLGKEAFADEMNKAFPITSAATTYVSNAYFLNKKAALQKKWGNSYISKVQQKLEKAAKLFRIEKDLQDYNSDFLKKEASDYDLSYVFSTKIDGFDIELFPVKTAADLIKAANDFSTNIKKYPFEWRSDISKGFLKKAEQFNVDELPDRICKYAGFGFFPDIPKIKEELRRRSSKLKTAADKEAFEKIAENISEGVSVEDIFKAAEVVYMTEKMAGLYDNPKVAELLPDPVELFFTVPYEKAAEDLNLVEIAGETYHLDDLKKVSKDAYEKALGFVPDFSNDKTAKEELETVPRSDFALLKETTGIRPVL